MSNEEQFIQRMLKQVLARGCHIHSERNGKFGIWHVNLILKQENGHKHLEAICQNMMCKHCHGRQCKNVCKSNCYLHIQASIIKTRNLTDVWPLLRL